METVFLHGFATSPQIWHNQKVDFAPDVNFESIEAEAEKLAELIAKEVILIGWSMGGMVAMKIAATVPQKIKALVLVSTTPKFLEEPCGIPSALLRKLTKRVKSEGIGAFHLLAFGSHLPEGLAFPSRKQMLKELDELARVDLREVLLEIRCPTLIIQGDRDEICLPKAAEYMKFEIRNSKLEILQEVGHAPMVEVPQLFNSLLRKFVKNYAG